MGCGGRGSKAVVEIDGERCYRGTAQLHHTATTTATPHRSHHATASVLALAHDHSAAVGGAVGQLVAGGGRQRSSGPQHDGFDGAVDHRAPTRQWSSAVMACCWSGAAEQVGQRCSRAVVQWVTGSEQWGSRSAGGIGVGRGVGQRCSGASRASEAVAQWGISSTRQPSHQQAQRVCLRRSWRLCPRRPRAAPAPPRHSN